MSAPAERRLSLPRGIEARVWEKGEGEPLGFLGGLRGLPRWIPFLDRLAERRRVIAPALPGFPGATGHRELDDLPDWLTATLDLLEQSGLDGADLVGASVGGALAAEVAAFSRASVRRLVLIAPLGLFDASEPVADLFALRKSEVSALLSSRPEVLEAFVAAPEGADEIEWQVVLARAQEAAARLLWPTGDLGLAKRLHRIQAPTLLLTGSEDRVLPASYAKRFADGLGGLVQVRRIDGAGHVLELDAPEAAADATLGFLGLTRMKALHLDGRDVRVVDHPVPEADASHALVRVALAGVCNTDLELVKGYMGFRGVLGHEFVGEVAEGPDEWRGRRVVGEINFACGRCDTCRRGLSRHCPARSVMGIQDADGATAEYVRVPVANLHAVPEGVPDVRAVFTEPLAAAFEIPEQVDVGSGTDCLVLGDGKLGLLVAQVLQASGARVLAVGHHRDNLDILARRGIETALESDWTPSPTPLVVEATGTTRGFQAAVAATRPRGTLVLKSTVAEHPSVDLAPLVIHEIQVVGSRCGPFEPALRALAEGAVDVASLVRERVPLTRAAEALERAARPGALKVLVEAR